MKFLVDIHIHTQSSLSVVSFAIITDTRILRYFYTYVGAKYDDDRTRQTRGRMRSNGENYHPRMKKRKYWTD